MPLIALAALLVALDASATGDPFGQHHSAATQITPATSRGSTPRGRIATATWRPRRASRRASRRSPRRSCCRARRASTSSTARRSTASSRSIRRPAASAGRFDPQVRRTSSARIVAAASPTRSAGGRRARRVPAPHLHRHQRPPPDRARCARRQALRRLRHARRRQLVEHERYGLEEVGTSSPPVVGEWRGRRRLVGDRLRLRRGAARRRSPRSTPRPARRAGRSIRCRARPAQAPPTPGRRSRWMPSATWCSCRPARRRPTTTACCGRAATATPTRSSRCASRPARWRGRSSWCTTTCGTTTRRRSRCCSSGAAPDGRRVPALAQVSKQGFVFVLDRRDGTAAAAGRGARRCRRAPSPANRPGRRSRFRCGRRRCCRRA